MLLLCARRSKFRTYFTLNNFCSITGGNKQIVQFCSVWIKRKHFFFISFSVVLKSYTRYKVFNWSNWIKFRGIFQRVLWLLQAFDFFCPLSINFNVYLSSFESVAWLSYNRSSKRFSKSSQKSLKTISITTSNSSINLLQYQAYMNICWRYPDRWWKNSCMGTRIQSAIL